MLVRLFNVSFRFSISKRFRNVDSKLIRTVACVKYCPNKAFKSDSQRLAFSLRSSIAKRCSHLNAALGFKEEVVSVNTTMGIQKFGFHCVFK